MSKIAFIPARSGSKGVKDKNIRPLREKPMILYTLDAAFQSNADQVVISTDSMEYFLLCESHINQDNRDHKKKLIHHHRPINLSGDTSSIVESIIHYFRQGVPCSKDLLAILQPTSPIRNPHHIDQMFDLVESGYDSAVSVSEPAQKPQEMLLKKDDHYSWLMGDPTGKQRQQYEEVWFINGSIYCYNIRKYLQNPRILLDRHCFYPMKQKYALDIDTYDDFDIAEALLSID